MFRVAEPSLEKTDLLRASLFLFMETPSTVTSQSREMDEEPCAKDTQFPGERRMVFGMPHSRTRAS